MLPPLAGGTAPEVEVVVAVVDAPVEVATVVEPLTSAVEEEEAAAELELADEDDEDAAADDEAAELALLEAEAAEEDDEPPDTEGLPLTHDELQASTQTRQSVSIEC